MGKEKFYGDAKTEAVTLAWNHNEEELPLQRSEGKSSMEENPMQSQILQACEGKGFGFYRECVTGT